MAGLPGAPGLGRGSLNLVTDSESSAIKQPSERDDGVYKDTRGASSIQFSPVQTSQTQDFSSRCLSQNSLSQEITQFVSADFPVSLIFK